MKESGNDPEYLVYRKPGGPILAACPQFRVRVGKYHQKLTGAHISGYFAGAREGLEPYYGMLPLPSLFGGEVDLTEAARALQTYLKRFRFPPVSSLELMTSERRVIESFASLGFRTWKAYGYFLTDLSTTPSGKIWADTFGKHDRQAIKYFDGLGTSFYLSSAEEDFARFLKLHQETMFQRGYRPLTEQFLALMRKHLGDRLQLALSVQSGQLIVGQLTALDRANQTVCIREIGYSKLRNIHSSVVHSWFKICEWAEKNDFRYIDFGGARADEAYRLKAKFGGEIIDKYVIVVPSASKVYPAVRGLLQAAKRTKSAVGRTLQPE